MRETPEMPGQSSPDRPSSELPILFFDSDCVLCLRSVNWIIPRDPQGVLSFAALDSQAADRWIPQQHPVRQCDSIIYCDQSGLYVYSDAAFRTLRNLSTGYRFVLLFSILPRPLTDAVYRWIAKRRHRWFGHPDSCEIPHSSKDRFLQ